MAPDYVLVPEGRELAFAEAVLAAACRAWPAIAGNPDYIAIVSPRHFERLLRAVAEARAAGATVFVHEDDGARRRQAGTAVASQAK